MGNIVTLFGKTSVCVEQKLGQMIKVCTVQNTNSEYSTIIGMKKVLDAAMHKPDTRRCNTLHDLTHTQKYLTIRKHTHSSDVILNRKTAEFVLFMDMI